MSAMPESFLGGIELVKLFSTECDGVIAIITPLIVFEQSSRNIFFVKHLHTSSR